MMIYYLEPHRLYLAVDDGELWMVQKASPGVPMNPHAFRVDRLRVTTGNLYVDRGTLALDGPGLLTLTAWWLRNHSTAKGRGLLRLFDHTSRVDVVVKAMWRIRHGREHEAVGEEAFFVSEQDRLHGSTLRAMRALLH